MPCSKHANDLAGFADEFSTGESYTVQLKGQLDDALGGGLLGVVERKKGKKRKRTESVSKDRKRTESESSAKERRRTESESSVKEETASRKRKRQQSEQSEAASEAEATPTPKKAAAKAEADPGWEEDFNPWESKKRSRADSEASEASSPKKLKTHLSKKEKKALDQVESEEIARAEKRVLDGAEDTYEPESPEEFDRLLLSSPNSSIVWVKYMAYHMGRKEPAKAREVAKRALEKINFR